MKQLPLLAMSVFFSVAAIAQSSFVDLNLRTFEQGIEPTGDVADRPEDDLLGTLRAEGDTIWHDSIADLSNWTLGTTGAFGTADSLWEHTLDGPYGTFSGTWGDVQSATSADGWVMFDSDGNGSADPNNGSPTGVEFDTYIQLASPIDLTSNPVVAVVFTEFYKALSSQTFLDVSTNGTDWTSIELHAGFTANDQTEQDAILYQDISPIAGGQSTVWIRLRFVGYGYFWQVDDIMFVEGVENDVELARIFTGNNEVDYLYSKKPLSQMTEMELGVAATNSGGLQQNNVVVDWEITDGSSTVANGTELIADSIVSGDSDTVFFTTGFTPTAIGNYTINMTVSSDETEANTSNNSGTESIEVTEYVWGHDYEDEAYQPYGYDAASANGMDGFEMGADYFCQVDGDFIYALVFALSNNTTAESIICKVYENDPANGAISETVYDLPSSQLSTNSNVKFITVVLDDPVEMISGNVYTATVAIDAGYDGYIMCNQIDDDDRGQSVYFVSEDTWYYWSGLTTTMRVNTNPEIASVEDDMESHGFGLYPNPAFDRLQINFKDNSGIQQVSIIDAAGRIVLSQAVRAGINGMSIDVSYLDAGAYMVSGATDQTITSQKLIIH